MVQVNVQIQPQLKRININDVLKSAEDYISTGEYGEVMTRFKTICAMFLKPLRHISWLFQTHDEQNDELFLK